MATDFELEGRLWSRGVGSVAGLDEVGRGCFAGPVVTGCVVFNSDLGFKIQDLRVRIDDSKKLTGNQRVESEKWIRENALACSVGEASVLEINKVGIKKATDIAFRRSIAKCQARIEYLLVDAFYIPNVAGFAKDRQISIPKGDGKSFSIAAASIIAKVYRDSLMVHLGKSKNLAVYGWDSNKGYGTQKHRDAIQKHGITKHHRKAFVETWTRKLT